MKDILELLGRILIAFIFLYEAADTILFYDNTLNTMQNYGITWHTNFFLNLVIFCLIVGAISVLIGYQAKVGAFLLLLYWLPFNMIVYSFWDDTVTYQRINALYFTRNLAICGGLLMLIANGAGHYSVKRMIDVMKLPE